MNMNTGNLSRSRRALRGFLKALLWITALCWVWKGLMMIPLAAGFGTYLAGLGWGGKVVTFFTTGVFGRVWLGIIHGILSRFWVTLMVVNLLYLGLFHRVNPRILAGLDRLRSWKERTFYRVIKVPMEGHFADFVRIFSINNSGELIEQEEEMQPGENLELPELDCVVEHSGRNGFTVAQLNEDENSEVSRVQEGDTFNLPDSDGALRVKHYGYKVPRVSENGFGSLPIGPALVQDADGILRHVWQEDQLWECEIGSGRKAYLLLKKHYTRWHARVYRAPQGVSCTVLAMKVKKKINHRPYEINVVLQVDGREYSSSLTHECRVYRPSVDAGEPCYLIYRSGYYPYTVAAMYGPVGCGKTCWAKALQDGTAGKYISRCLIDGLTIPAMKNPGLQMPQGHTPLGSMRPVCLELVEDQEVVGCVYLVDLSGEISRCPDVDSGSDPDRRLAAQVVSSVCELTNVLFVLMDHRSVCPREGDELDGDPTATLHQMEKKIEKVFVCTNADTIYDRVAERPLYDEFLADPEEPSLLLTANSPLFDRVAAKNGSSKSRMLAHMAAANDLIRTQVDGIADDAPCFLVQSMEVIKDEGTGVELHDYSKQVNAELPLAWLIQRSFGQRIA